MFAAAVGNRDANISAVIHSNLRDSLYMQVNKMFR